MGMVLFVVNAATKVPLIDIVREILPFLAVLIFTLFAMVLWPDAVLWLPRIFGYQGQRLDFGSKIGPTNFTRSLGSRKAAIGPALAKSG